jgi:hypothetical protein
MTGIYAAGHAMTRVGISEVDRLFRKTLRKTNPIATRAYKWVGSEKAECLTGKQGIGEEETR